MCSSASARSVFTETQRIFSAQVLEKTDIKNLCRAVPELAISLLPPGRLQTYVTEFDPAMYAKHKWLSICAERNASLGPPN